MVSDHDRLSHPAGEVCQRCCIQLGDMQMENIMLLQQCSGCREQRRHDGSFAYPEGDVDPVHVHAIELLTPRERSIVAGGQD